MTFKNFVFRRKWDGSEMAGMKIVFFAIFDPFWTHILAPKDPKKCNSLNRILVFNFLERQKLYYYQVCDLSTDETEVKPLK